MSSNITVTRICQNCSKGFIAKTTVTRYCSTRCARAAYKARLRSGKIEKVSKVVSVKLAEQLQSIQSKEILTVRDVSALLGLSLKTVYRLINSDVIKAVNLSERITRIRKVDIDELLRKSEPIIPKDLQKEYAVSDCYNMKEIQQKFGVSEKALYDIIKRNNIPRFKKGKFSYVPRVLIHQIFR